MVECFLDAVSNDGVFIVRLLVAMVLGAFVGLERQTRGRAAGLRTNILVCLGSAAIIVAFQKLSVEFNVGAESVIRMDPARAAAGVITGIGFLGAGTIVKSNDFVRGLTTAASIWVVSAIGVTVGLGEFVIACVLTLLVLVALYALHRLPITGDHYFSLNLKWVGDLALLAEITEQLCSDGVQIKNRSVTRQPKTGSCHVTLVLRMRKEEMDAKIVDRLQADERFDEVGWH
jgi:putative Mg2+ transporter-C (MgtC) family protein